MANRETKTACSGNKVGRTRGRKGTKQQYGDNSKCSVGVFRGGATTETGGGALNVTDSKFQRGISSHKNRSSSEKNPSKNAAASAFIHGMTGIGVRGIREEFVHVVKSFVPKGSCDACAEHADANRYEDVMCLDQTRVKLKNTDGEYGDYIHASYVQIHPDLVYICTQGPLSNTVEQFWQMVIEQQSKVILQLCQNTEDGKEKCAEYFPPYTPLPPPPPPPQSNENDAREPKPSEWKSYGMVMVRVMGKTHSVPATKDVVKHRLQVKMGDDKVHDVTHLLYKGWSDHTVADSPSTITGLRTIVHATYFKKPIVCHCSAGIGRTGSFVLLEIAVHHLVTLNDFGFNMPTAVKDIRKQRMSSIQNDQQYVFVFRCLIDVLLRENLISRSDDVQKFLEDYQSFINRKKGAKRAKGHA